MIIHVVRLFSPDTGTGKLTVGKVYGGILIHDNWKKTKFGNIHDLRRQEEELEAMEAAEAEEDRKRRRQEAMDRGEDMEEWDRMEEVRAAEEAEAKKAEEDGERERDRESTREGIFAAAVPASNVAALTEGYYNDEVVGGEDAYYNQGNNGQGMGRGRMMG